jgi:hypothetical protein
MGVKSREGIRFLAPEIQLFYKAKAPRPKDWLDFTMVLPSLTCDQRAWLRDAILIAYGEDNDWLAELCQWQP